MKLQTLFELDDLYLDSEPEPGMELAENVWYDKHSPVEIVGVGVHGAVVPIADYTSSENSQWSMDLRLDGLAKVSELKQPSREGTIL